MDSDVRMENNENKNENKNEKVLVFYHDPCWDGMTSAAIFAMKYQSSSSLELIGIPPSAQSIQVEQCRNKIVYMVDVAPSLELYQQIKQVALKIKILDHHETNQDNDRLGKVPQEDKVFDMKKCGAQLAWQECFPHQMEPRFLQYVAAYDLWEFDHLAKIEDHKSMIMLQPLDMNKMMEYLKMTYDEYETELKGFERVTQLRMILMKDMLKKSVQRLTWIQDQVYLVTYVQCSASVLVSDVGALAVKQFPLSNFAAVYRHNHLYDTTTFSLRSDEKHENVGALAKKLGGGGHRNASSVILNGNVTTMGSTTDPGDLVKILTNEIYKYQVDPTIFVINYPQPHEMLTHYLFRYFPPQKLKALLYYRMPFENGFISLKCRKNIIIHERDQLCEQFHLDKQTGQGQYQFMDHSLIPIRLFSFS